ncbi:MAG: peptidoglycan-binding protein, partial [Aristaeellaceae bacterium]
MKRIRILLAAILAVVLLTSVLFISEAEPATEEVWQADLLKLMDPADVPRTTHIQYENTYDEGATVAQKDVACEVTVNDVTYGCEFVFEVVGDSEPDWSAIQQWLGGIVTESARTAGSDSESLAKAIDKAIRSARKSAQPDSSGALPEWASESIQVSDIRVSTPFYPELELGKNGEATKRLQQSLIAMGFLNDRADGYFGERTKLAVEALESYVRELEQELIDARPVETPTPAPTATPVATATVAATPESKHQLTLVPKNTPVPTAEPTEEPAPEATEEAMEAVTDEPALQPVTQVDGVADALLQAYLYSDSFVAVRGELKTGSSGTDVTRLQTRLLNLGCSVSEPDGSYGSSTARAVRVFQYANGLSQTGVADEQTLALLFSADAKAPAHAMLSLGSTGDDVTELQKRLLYLGFTTASADGSYGTATQTAVQRLQEYVRGIETLAVKAADPTIAADADVSDRLTTVVDGVADPILLDIFYSDKFPVVPGELGGGS